MLESVEKCWGIREIGGKGDSELGTGSFLGFLNSVHEHVLRRVGAWFCVGGFRPPMFPFSFYRSVHTETFLAGKIFRWVDNVECSSSNLKDFPLVTSCQKSDIEILTTTGTASRA